VPEILVTINGRHYRMACEDGEEEHLLRLAKQFDDRITMLREKLGEIGDSRLSVMAALTVEDDLWERDNKILRLEKEIAGLLEARTASAERSQATQSAYVAALTTAADRIEAIAKKLNQTTVPGGQAARG
jgi:cell division protein ZapA